MRTGRRAVILPLALLFVLILFYLGTVTVWKAHENAGYTRMDAGELQRFHMAKAITNQAVSQLLDNPEAAASLSEITPDGVSLSTRVEPDPAFGTLIHVIGTARMPGAPPVSYSRILMRSVSGSPAIFVGSPASIAIYNGGAWGDVPYPPNIYYEERVATDAGGAPLLNPDGTPQTVFALVTDPGTKGQPYRKGDFAADNQGQLYYLNTPDPNAIPFGDPARNDPASYPIKHPTILVMRPNQGWLAIPPDPTRPETLAAPNAKISFGVNGMQASSGSSVGFSSAPPVSPEVGGGQSPSSFQLQGDGSVVHNIQNRPPETLPPPGGFPASEIATTPDGEAYVVGLAPNGQGAVYKLQKGNSGAAWSPVLSTFDAAGGSISNLFVDGYGKPAYNVGDDILYGGKVIQGRKGPILAVGGSYSSAARVVNSFDY